MFVGISGWERENRDLEVALSTHDGTYGVHFCTHYFRREDLEKSPSNPPAIITDLVLSELKKYQVEHRCKFLGAGVTKTMAEDLCPELCSKLWAGLDIVPMVFAVGMERLKVPEGEYIITLGEQADSMARKCIMLVVFLNIARRGANPRPQVLWPNPAASTRDRI
jgi:alpha,alpha-trehalose phosphorylase (configuration-retaining)